MKIQLRTHLFWSLIGILLGCMMFLGVGMEAQAKTIELSFSHHLPPISPVAKALEEIAKRIESDTGGRIEITIYPSGTLSKSRDAYASTSGGICDIAFINNVYERKRWALNQIVNLLALPIPTNEKGIHIWEQLWEKFPVMLDEFKDVKVLAHSINPPSALHTKKKILIPADIKGMKIAAFGDKVKLLQIMGASPVGISANDWYLSLEKGVIEGTFCPYGLLVERGIENLTPYHLDLKMGQGGNYIIMNLHKWNSLPTNIKSKIEQIYPWANEHIANATGKLAEDSVKKCLEQSHTITPVLPEEMKPWLIAAQPTADAWIRENRKRGPTQEMFDYAKKLLEEIEK